MKTLPKLVHKKNVLNLQSKHLTNPYKRLCFTMLLPLFLTACISENEEIQPSEEPNETSAPAQTPTPISAPIPTSTPRPNPTLTPEPSPTLVPVPVPTQEPAPVATQEPTPVPTQEPAPVPTQEPTPVPTQEPTPVPTQEPTPVPTQEPTPVPTQEPNPAPNNQALIRSDWSLDSSNNSAELNFAIDGDTDTRWSTRQFQTPNQWLFINFGKIENIDQLELNSEESPNDYPRSYEVYASVDGIIWTELTTQNTQSNGTTTITFDAVQAELIRIIQQGSAEQYWWSIYELNAYYSAENGQASPLPTATPAPTPVLSGEDEYVAQCVMCHGSEGDNGLFPLKNEELDRAAMILTIRDTMPKGNAAACDESCAERVTDYIKDVLFNANENPSPVIAAAPATGRRLTKTEYLYTVEDLLEVQTDELSNIIIDDLAGAGFRNGIDALLPSGNRIDAYEMAATYIAQDISNNKLQSLSSCTTIEEECVDSFIENTGRLLYRRPLREAQKTALGNVFQISIDESENFYDGARLTLRAMLQSPYFLYRLENSNRSDPSSEFALIDEYELATRLSYMLWQSAPTDTLLNQTQEGGLNEDNINDTINSMLNDPKAKRMLESFISEWLNIYNLDNRGVDTDKYMDFDDELISDMKTEIFSYFERIVFDTQAPFMTAYTDQQTTFSQRLADEVYFEGTGGLHDWSDNIHRSGFLTQSAFLTVHTAVEETSIVDRGLFVLGGLLCKPIPELPDGLDAAGLFANIDPTRPQRERFELHRSDENACGFCHQTFDGLGYGFEAFNAIGGFQEMDENGNTISFDGFANIDGNDSFFSNISEFSQQLASSEQAKNCVVEKTLGFAFGRTIDEGDRALVDDLVEKFDLSNQNFIDLVKNIVSTDVYLKSVQAD